MSRKLHISELNRVTSHQFKSMERLPIVIVMDNIRSAHNIGAAFRTADAFAIEALYLCGICAKPPSSEIRKSALGAEESVPWEYFSDTLEAITKLKAEGYTVVSMEQTVNSISLKKFRASKDKSYAIVFGNEVKGVSQQVVNMSDLILEIPQFGTKHSLNVSVSVGIALWHFVGSLRDLTL